MFISHWISYCFNTSCIYIYVCVYIYIYPSEYCIPIKFPSEFAYIFDIYIYIYMYVYVIIILYCKCNGSKVVSQDLIYSTMLSPRPSNDHRRIASCSLSSVSAFCHSNSPAGSPKMKIRRGVERCLENEFSTSKRRDWL